MSFQSLNNEACFESDSHLCEKYERISFRSIECEDSDTTIQNLMLGQSNSDTYRIAADVVLGRYIMANRTITEGEVILEDTPLVTGPGQYSPLYCLACYRIMPSVKQCSKCGWPICSSECERSMTHKPECEMTVKCRKQEIPARDLGDEFLFQDYIINELRCLYLKKTQSDEWEKLSQLESHSENIRKSYYDMLKVSMMDSFIRSYLNFTNFTKEDLIEIIGIMKINVFKVVNDTPCTAVYNTASLFEHSCCPNCYYRFTEDGKIVVQAQREIRKGEHLSIAYINIFEGTMERQKTLMLTKFFLCRCERCSDQTEFGSHLSSVKCTTRHCKGYVGPSLTETPLQYQWWCQQCRAFNDGIEELLEFAMEELEKIFPDNLTSYENFMEKYLKFFHPNHYILAKARMKFLNFHNKGEILNVLSEDDLYRMVDICRAMVDPYSRFGTIGYISVVELHRIECALLQEIYNKKNEDDKNEESIGILLMMKNCLEKIRDLLKHPGVSSDFKNDFA